MKISSKFLKKIFGAIKAHGKGNKKNKKLHSFGWKNSSHVDTTQTSPDGSSHSFDEGRPEARDDDDDDYRPVHFIVCKDGDMKLANTTGVPTSKTFEMEWSSSSRGDDNDDAERTPPPPPFVVHVDPSYLQEQQLEDDEANNDNGYKDHDEMSTQSSLSDDLIPRTTTPGEGRWPPYHRQGSTDDTTLKANSRLNRVNIWSLDESTVAVNSVVQWGDYSVAIVPTGGGSTVARWDKSATLSTYSFVPDDYSVYST